MVSEQRPGGAQATAPDKMKMTPPWSDVDGNLHKLMWEKPRPRRPSVARQAKFGRFRANVGRIQPISAECGASRAQFGFFPPEFVDIGFGRIRPEVDRCGANLGPFFADVGTIVSEIETDLTNLGPILDDNKPN